MYFCGMRYLPVLSFLLLMICCKDKTKPDQTADGKKIPAYVTDLMERVKKYPDSTGLRFRLVDALDSLGMYKEGLAQIDSLISKDSLNNSLWMRKGMLQERAKDTASAIISYARSINIYPAIDAQLYLANLLAERKNDTALLLVNAVSRTMFDRRTLAECDFIAGIYHARKGNVQMAVQLFDRCISNDLKFMEAYIEKGVLFYDQKKFDEALRVFQAAANVEPTYADAFYWQAKTYEATGKIKEAIDLYNQSLRLDPNMKEASDALARLGVHV
jgi:tetratricopeptide (TPR) repeat protein